MPADPAVVAALTAAVDTDPTNRAVRLHLATVLLDGDEPGAADPHVRAVLDRDPADLDALGAAVRCADALGDTDRALGYRRLLAALGGSTRQEPPNAPPPVPATGPLPAPPGDEDDFDQIIAGLGSDLAEVERPTVRLDDVGGLESVKEQLWVDFLGPMRNAELRAMYGTGLGGGLLLYGPPGCGKTFLARALAGELGANFVTVGLHDVLDMWLGESESNLHELFETARANAPCLLFLDEIDALGQKRAHLRHSAGRNVVVQLLTELDGVTSSNDELFVLGATNAPWDVDPALRRPGRFDRTVLVLPPDEPARLAILTRSLDGRPVERLDPAAIARRTDGYSGADLALIGETAARRAMAESMRTGVARPIRQEDLDAAAAEVRPSIGPWLDTARNFAEFGNEHGEYDDLLRYLRRRRGR